MIADVTRSASALSGKRLARNSGMVRALPQLSVCSRRRGATTIQLTNAPTEQADADPHFDQSGGIERTRQTEQQPARHVGRPGRQGRNRRAELRPPSR